MLSYAWIYFPPFQVFSWPALLKMQNLGERSICPRIRCISEEETHIAWIAVHNNQSQPAHVGDPKDLVGAETCSILTLCDHTLYVTLT